MTTPSRPDDVFGRAADADGGAVEYERGRPGYPARLIEWWGARGAFGPGRRVLDLGAGTGKLTRLLPSECDVVAVEPSAEMRTEFGRVVESVEVVEGRAERLPFESDSFDTVLVAQAFQWFDAPVALTEIARVLVAGGGLGLVWNQDDDYADDWVEMLVEVKRNLASSPIAAGIAAANAISDHPAFDPADQTQIRWRRRTTADAVVADVSSRSYVRTLGASRRREVATMVRSIVDPLGEAFDYPYRTVAFWAQRSG